MGVRIFLVVALSFGVDLLLLMAVFRINGLAVKLIPVLCGALIGGVYTLLCMDPRFLFLGAIGWRLIIFCVSGVIAYELSMKLTTQFVLLELAFYGMTAERTTVLEWVLPALVFGVLFLIAFGSKRAADCVSVRVYQDDACVDFQALRDSGNMLNDPISGLPVLVVSSALSERLIGLPAEDLNDPLQCMMGGFGLRLIPYHTVGSNGLLLAKKFDKVSVNGQIGPRILAFSPNEIGAGKHYRALTGGT